MTEFNSMTLMAAGEVIAEMSTQPTLSALTLSWGVEDFCNSGSVASRVNDLVRFAKSRMGQQRHVPTARGFCDLPRAMIEHAITASENVKQNRPDAWSRLLAGLRMDGFEVAEDKVPDPSGKKSIFGDKPVMLTKVTLRRMLPASIPGTDLREVDDEVSSLLKKHGLSRALGHLQQATATFQSGHWSSANAMIRDFYQELLDKIAEKLGCDPKFTDDQKRQYLASPASGPFLYHEYNEWENDRGKPSYVLGLWARLHPHGSHPGLSDEDDCTFRFQIILITARVFLRRLDKKAGQQ